MYKVKPKVPQQFKAAEVNGVPFAIFLGDDEVASGKVKIKEMGLRDGHPEKEGILVDQKEMVAELRTRLQRKKQLDDVARQAEGLKVVDGIKDEPAAASSEAPKTSEEPAAPSAVDLTP
jgi:histidyl-tRNA synthetase